MGSVNNKKSLAKAVGSVTFVGAGPGDEDAPAAALPKQTLEGPSVSAPVMHQAPAPLRQQGP